MPAPLVAGLGIAAASVGGAALGASAQKSAAKTAARAETQAAQMQVDEARAAREQMRALLEPYTSAGGSSLAAMLNLAGLSGNPAQADAVAGIENSPMFQALVTQGEDAILQNASATGGLRGGNVQGALAQFRPAFLNQQIQEQYGRLAGITQLGQNSAAGVGNAGLTAAQMAGQAYGNMGAAQAGAALAGGRATAGLYSSIGSGIGQLAGSFNFGGGAPFAAGLTAQGAAALAPGVANMMAANPGIF